MSDFITRTETTAPLSPTEYATVSAFGFASAPTSSLDDLFIPQQFDDVDADNLPFESADPFGLGTPTEADDIIEAHIWYGQDDLGDIQHGDVIRSVQAGLTIDGVAHHVGATGCWYTAEGGLLVVNTSRASWTVLDRPEPEPEVDLFGADTEVGPWTVAHFRRGQVGALAVLTPEGDWVEISNGEVYVRKGDALTFDTITLLALGLPEPIVLSAAVA
jgi:hypothetical protein